MIDVKKIVVAGAFFLVAHAASATTVKVDCGVIADGASVVCEDEFANDSFNLALHGVNYLFEAQVSDTAIIDQGETALLDGTLTIQTYVDPYWSTGTAATNIILYVSGIGSGSVSFGGDPVAMFEQGGSLVSGFLTAYFPESGMLDLVLNYQGLTGGNGISITLSAVPLPAGGLLLLTALGGLGLARRRRSADPAIA